MGRQRPSKVGNIRGVCANLRDMAGYQTHGSGWVRLYGQSDRPNELLPGILYFRGSPDSEGRYRIRELYLDATDSDPITGETLRGIPIWQLESELNLRMAVEHRPRKSAGPDLSGRMRRLFSKFGFVTSYDPMSDAPHGKPMLALPASEDEGQEYRLTEGPGADGLSDAFLERVAKAYRAAVARGDRPNREIAASSGHGIRTVESWVAKARTRNILSKGRKGVAG
jgi:hypothetical protein